MGPSRHLRVLLSAMVATQHAVRSERHSQEPADKPTSLETSPSKQRLMLGLHGPQTSPRLPSHPTVEGAQEPAKELLSSGAGRRSFPPRPLLCLFF